MTNTTIAIASDHRGLALKEQIKTHLRSIGIKVTDYGPQNRTPKVDYPDFAKLVSQSVLSNESQYGILICHTGIGMSIAANRFKGIRAALCANQEYALLSKKHNNANVLVFGAGYITKKETISCINCFLNSKFEEERHIKRIQMLDNL